MTDSSSGSDLLLETLPENGTPPRTRIKDAASAREIYMRLRRADEASARTRSQIESMMAGEPPYDDAELRATGQAARTNVNWGEAEGLLETALAGYVDLLSSVETLVNVKTKFGDPQERPEYEQTIAEEITRLLRGWNAYTPNWLRLSTYFVGQGVGIAYFENDLDWRWRVGGLSDFLIPRETLAAESEIEVACCPRSMMVHQLYQFIADEEAAAAMGWDVEAVKEAIKHAVSGSASQLSTFSNNWEAIVKEMKSNDLYAGVATASKIKVVHVWNVEFDGMVTHSIITDQEVSGVKNFLYRKVGKFSKMDQALTVFTYGTGVNGTYHSIRGLGAKVFSEIQASNRLRCQMLDGAMLSSSVMLQPTNEEALQNLQLSYFGPYTLLTPGVNVVERQITNTQQAVMPVLSDMARLINARTGVYAAEAADPSGIEKTKYQVKAEQSQRVRLSTASLALFYEPLDRLFREVVRRICRRDYYPAEPGGRQVADFRRRCHERGVPMEAIYNVDPAKVTSVRAIGAGSEQMRQIVFEELDAIAPALDEYGRQNLLRDKVAARIGYDNTDRFIQKPTAEARPVIDEKMANLETASLLKGERLPVYPNDNHRVHARVHITALSAQVQGVNEGQLDILQILDGLVEIQEHTIAHVEEMGKDPSLQQEAAANRQALQNADEVITNGLRHREKLRRQEMEQQGQQQQDPAVGPTSQGVPGNADMDARLRMRIAENQAKLVMLREQADLKRSIAIQDAQQRMAIRDAEAAHKLSLR